MLVFIETRFQLYRKLYSLCWVEIIFKSWTIPKWAMCLTSDVDKIG